MLRLEGPIVAQLQAVFLLSWQFQGGPLPATAAGLDRFFPPRARRARRGRRDARSSRTTRARATCRSGPAFRDAVDGASAAST